MGTFSIWHIVAIAVVGLLLFGGGGKISGLLGDAAKGIKAFKDGLKDEANSPPAKAAADDTKAAS